MRLKLGAGLLAAMIAFLLAPAWALGAAPVGSLAQLGGSAGCNQLSGGADSCATATGLGQPTAVAVSPDGKNAYAVSTASNAVTEFSRDPTTGALTQLASPNDCIAQAGTECVTNTGRGLSEARAVAVSPDGRSVYVASTDSPGTPQGGESPDPAVQQQQAVVGCAAPNCAGAVAVFQRDPATGVLTQPSGPAGCVSENAVQNSQNEISCASGTGLADADAVVVSPFGDHVYVASGDSNAVAVFKRDPSTGALTQLATPNDCIGESGGSECGTSTAHGLKEAFSVAISPDGKNVYTASQDGAAVAAFARDLGTGALTQLTGADACLAEGAMDGCSTGRGLLDASSVALSPDGKNVYTAGDNGNAAAIFKRDAGTGALTQLADAAGCLQAPGGSDGCAAATGLSAALGIVVAPDGASVYAGSTGDNAVSEFSRDPGSGALTQLAPPDDCVAQAASACSTTTARGVRGAHGLALSPDGEHLYAAGADSNALAAFERADQPPTCRGANVTIASGQPNGLPLPCSDPNRNPLTRSIVSGPAHGTLGPIDQRNGQALYTPAPGFAGADAISFQATDGSESSNTAVVAVAVTPPGVASAHCTLGSAQAKKPARGRALSARKRSRVAPKAIALTVRCDQDAAVSLTGTVTVKAKKARRATAAQKRKGRIRTRRFTLTPRSARVRANVALTVTEKLKKSLRRLLERRGAKAAASFALTATNSNGTTHATSSISRLRLVKKHRRRRR